MDKLVNTTEAEANNQFTAGGIVELAELQLALVGGGVGEITPY